MANHNNQWMSELKLIKPRKSQKRKKKS
jgi:hypothetical protein